MYKTNFRTPQTIYHIYRKSHEELFAFIDDLSVNEKLLCILTIEVYKYSMKPNPDFIWHFYTKNLSLIAYALVKNNICLKQT